MLALDLQRRAMAAHKDPDRNADVPFHEPAMVQQVLDALQPQPGDTAVDVTLGTAGHSLALSEAVGPDGLLIGLDADASAVETARSRLEEAAHCPFQLFNAPFSRLPHVMQQAGLRKTNVLVADLGVGTHQLLNAARGLSFDATSRLDMRFDPSGGLSAWQVVNETPEQELESIFRHLGEERYSRQIAAQICRRRAEAPIDTPAELADIAKGVYARRSRRGQTWRIHPATRVMMALRIHVNRELEELDALLQALPTVMARGARAAVLTYHSLEARRVKQAWRRQKEQGLLELPRPAVVKPDHDEIERNPRARSAQLRACRRT
jgi:16S rRNA (cytosine1402-N4)-methyltransferase